MWRVTYKIIAFVCVFAKFAELSGQSSSRRNNILMSMVNFNPSSIYLFTLIFLSKCQECVSVLPLTRDQLHPMMLPWKKAQSRRLTSVFQTKGFLFISSQK